jgi:serine/threonine protein phosphatase 1
MPKRTLFISDIHGQAETLTSLLSRVDYRPESDQLVLLGDYVGDCLSNLQCLILVRQLVERDSAVALMGNHDHELTNFLSTTTPGDGTQKKQRSYVLALAQEIRRQQPELITFLAQLPLWYEREDFIAVHAGLNPDLTDWRTASPTDFTTIRRPFLDSCLDLGKPVVFGHTPCINIHGSPDVWYGNGKIGIDGGVSHLLQLNCLILQDREFTSVSVPLTR